MSYPGALIAVEGVDGSGKSTQIHLLHEWLKSSGRKVHFSEWNSSPIVKAATKRGKKEKLLTPTTGSLVHATDFADRYERQILPRLKAGEIVLCDRYMYTAFARDGARNVDRAWLEDLYGYAVKPDITFYYDLPLEVSLDRILRGRPVLKYHEAGMDMHLHEDIEASYKMFQGIIREQYLGMVKEHGLVKMDATKSIHEQQKQMRKIVKQHIDLSEYDLDEEEL